MFAQRRFGCILFEAAFTTTPVNIPKYNSASKQLGRTSEVPPTSPYSPTAATGYWVASQTVGASKRAFPSVASVISSSYRIRCPCCGSRRKWIAGVRAKDKTEAHPPHSRTGGEGVWSSVPRMWAEERLHVLDETR